MSTTVSSDEIFAALNADRAWQATPPTVAAAMQPFIVALPEILANLLAEQFTLRTYFEAKGAFVKHLLESGYIEEMEKVMLESVKNAAGASGELTSVFEDFDISALISRLRGQLEEMLTGLPKLAALLTPEYIKQCGMTERAVLIKNGLSGEALAVFDQGELTLADLLRIQPLIIVRNS